MNKKRIIAFIPLLFAFVMLFLLLGSILGLSDASHDSKSPHAQVLSSATMTIADGDVKDISFPHRIIGLKPRTTVSLSMDFNTIPGDSLYVKSVYAPLLIYANGRLIYQYGTPGSYPSYFTDPPTETMLVSLPSDCTHVSLTMVYQSPAARDTLMLYAPVLGSDTAILHHLAGTMGFSFLFSIIQIFLGLLLILISFLLIPFDKKGWAVFWLGMFALVTGIWMFSESNLTVYILQMPALLYLLAFIGLFSVPIPLLCFAMNILDLQHSRLLQFLTLLSSFSLCIAMLLQLTGMMPFSKSMYYFHILVPLCIVVLAVTFTVYAIRDHQSLAAQFAPLFIVLAISSVLEVLNYKVRFTNQLSSVFQLGILVFILIAEILAGNFIRNSLELREKNHILKFNLDMMERQMGIQEERNQLLLTNAEAVREQRHDLRHQYAVLQQFCDHKEYEELSNYLHSLVAAIPSGNQRQFCENNAADAIISYYASLAGAQQFALTINAVIPPRLENVSDRDLCIMIGNLLENAIEACTQMAEEDGERFIRFSSRLQGESLFITMDNSFNGNIAMQDGQYLSHKRHEVGTGLISIRSVAEKHDGKALFQANGKTFLSSVYVHI